MEKSQKERIPRGSEGFVLDSALAVFCGKNAVMAYRVGKNKVAVAIGFGEVAVTGRWGVNGILR